MLFLMPSNSLVTPVTSIHLGPPLVRYWVVLVVSGAREALIKHLKLCVIGNNGFLHHALVANPPLARIIPD